MANGFSFESVMNNRNISVVLPTYRGDTPSELAQAIDSLSNQTLIPEELFIVKDGPLTHQLESVIYEKMNDFPTSIQTYQIEENQGLGNALRVGLENCSYNIVARMDADDISVPSRFELQLEFLCENPSIDIVGGHIGEFDTDPNNILARREVPRSHREIEKMAKFRSPMNHGTVLFYKKSVLNAGNYRPVNRMEDYDLWVRMLLNGARFANIPDILVKVRAGDEMYERRGGWEYAHEEARRQVEFYRRDFTSFPIFLFNILSRTSLRIVPKTIRKFLYNQIARK